MANYIQEYYDKIQNGEIIVGKWILKVYEYLIHGLEDKRFFFNERKADLCITFIENFVHHHEGALAPSLFKLELWQKALLSAIFGIVDENGKRVHKEICIEIGRKNGKTLLASAIAQFVAYCEPDFGKRIYFAAPKLKQANLCFDAFYQSILKEPSLSEITKKRRTDIYIAESNTSCEPLAFSSGKSDGLNISLGICDEISSWSGDSGLKYYEVLKSSQGAREEPLLVSISTSGFVNESIFDELERRCTRFLLANEDETRETTLLPFLYKIDDIKKWNEPSELAKANPNLGVSVPLEYLQNEAVIASMSLSKKSEFITKYCNLKQNSSQAWLDAQDVQRACGEPLQLEDYKSNYCTVGIDLSRTSDLTSCCAVVEKNGELYVFSKFFLPSNKIQEASARDGLPYDIYVQRGLLKPSGENVVDYKDCLQWIVDLVREYEILPLKIGYDRYSATYLIQDLMSLGLQVDDVFQGTNLTPVIREFEGIIKDGKIHIGDNDLLKVHLLNTSLKIDSQQERCQIVKIAKNDHIDGTAALLDALCVRQKWYGEIGEQLKN